MSYHLINECIKKIVRKFFPFNTMTPKEDFFQNILDLVVFVILHLSLPSTLTSLKANLQM